MRNLIKGLIVIFLLIGPLRPAAADNPILSGFCSYVDCLNNFTAKTGWSFNQKQLYAGGFTDLKQKWYISGGPGFDVPINRGPNTGTPNLDVNVILKVGQFLSDKITPIHVFVNSDPFLQGLMAYSTIGESASYDYTRGKGKWYDLSWAGFTYRFGASPPPPVPAPVPVPKPAYVAPAPVPVSAPLLPGTTK
jgi:hypothetical protein